ncbi:MAG TPA: histidine kinase dimerization/phospho-acceptor domain-containing protein [Opitutaceae bacterium]|jgi:NtrC-family two-component system sensor histidine kinase KinB|nr:histidine kinase dimerization/phospho-acceptor domain-containing protein [Opitutaceae bacterium]
MLRTRLYLGLLPLLLLFLAVGFYALSVCRELAKSIEVDLVRNYRTLIAGYELRDAATRMHGALTHLNRTDTLEARQAFETERSRLKRLLFDQALASSGTPRTALVERIDEAHQELVAQAEASVAPGVPRALDRYRAAEARFFGALSAIEALAHEDYAHVQEVSASTARTVKLAVNLLAAAMVVAILLSLFLSYRLARGLLQPIQAITASARALGEGRLETTVPVLSGDELGQMAEVFNDMAGRLRRYRDAMREEVRRAQRTTEATLTASPDPVVVVTREGLTELLNPAAQELGLGGGKLPESLSQAVQRVIDGGQHDVPTGYDRVVTLRNGHEERHYLPRILAISDTMTGLHGAAVILQDVTKFRLLDDAKNNLVGTVSHELKTPLTGLRLSVYLLLESNLGPLTPDQRELLETARDGADRLLRIINDLLDLSRLEAGVSALHRSRVPLPELLAEMAREMRPLVEAAGQAIVIECPDETVGVWVDRDRIRHVFINLLSNASKYSPEGGTITLYATASDPGFARCGVRDRGPGIEPESAARVFDRFYRVPGQTKVGAGLGLTIAREIVVAHGGSIACTSEVGVGSDFYFMLPRAD